MTAPSHKTADPISAFMSWVTEDERALRRRLLGFQQTAGTRARQTTDERARHEWKLAQQLASEHVFGPAGADRLQEVLRTVTRIALTANNLEDWSRVDG